jgi:uncharacterized protein (TIGR03083 family)
MDPIDATRVSAVTDVLGPERAELLELLGGLGESDWELPTECPKYSVKGIATHILGDDLSLLSRQRDGAMSGLFLVAEKMPSADFRELLNGFNDQWVEAARFLSAPLLIELLRLSGDSTSTYYIGVDPTSPGEPVPMFDLADHGASPVWQSIAREYLERWTHHSQIRRALGKPSLADSPFFEVGIRIVATIAGEAPLAPSSPDGDWSIGPMALGPLQQAADILTLAHTASEVQGLADGPTELVDNFASRVSRRTDD